MTDEPDDPPAKNLGGRPPLVFDEDRMDIIRNSAAIGCTVNEIASVLGVSRTALFKYMALNQDVQDAIDAGRDKGCATLRRSQWQRAMGGSDTMMIWLGKNMLGQRDKSETVSTVSNVNIDVTDPVEASRAYQRLMQDK